jgi:hypothetical protein
METIVAASWPELTYAAGKDTCSTLQLWTQIVGKVRLWLTPWINHEQAFSKLKAHLRKAAEHTIPGLMRRIGRVVAAFSPQECRNFLRHAGYVQT